MARYQTRSIGVFDTQTGLHIKRNNIELWKEYNDWLAQGNVADPVTQPDNTPTQADIDAANEATKRKSMRNELKADNTIDYLRNHTLAEVDQWVVTNVTDLASAKTLLRKLSVIVAYLARERFNNRE